MKGFFYVFWKWDSGQKYNLLIKDKQLDLAITVGYKIYLTVPIKL